MKKIFFVVSMAFLASCSNELGNEGIENTENVTTNISTAKLSTNDYDFSQIGLKHNNALQSIYNRLSQEADIKNLDSTKLKTIIFKETNALIVNDKDFANLEQEIIDKIDDRNDVGYLESELYSKLKSDISKSFLNDFKLAFDSYMAANDAESIKILSANLNNIQNKIIASQQNMDGVEYFALRSLVSTALSSSGYWNDNLDNWNTLLGLNSGNTLKRDWGWFKSTIKKMAVADAYGAGVGAIVGAVTASPTGPGILVGAAAGAVGYGCNSSAMAGIRELI